MCQVIVPLGREYQRVLWVLSGKAPADWPMCQVLCPLVESTSVWVLVKIPVGRM